MSYLPLARKYRPKTFSELVGQESTALALSNAIKIGREPHGLIFSGVRGVGKTTTARIYAKALNCSNGPTPDPCQQCENCLAIAAGHHEDVLEIDGASNTGVDDVRQLRETIEYVPQRSKFKVYIIDEVHMLSQSAFNALLKTLEEPPAHVVFVFATTELQKLPQTILSRCQTFYLSKILLSGISQQLAAILQAEEVTFEDKALQMIANEAAGSMRDALTLLDQAIALGGGQVTVEGLQKVFSNVSSEPVLQLLQAVVSKNGSSCLQAIAQLDEQGVDYRKLVEQLIKFTRHAMILGELKDNPQDSELLGLDDGEVATLKNLYTEAPTFDLNRIFRSLVKCLSELTGSHLDRYVVENYLFEWCFDPGLPQLDQLIQGSQVHRQSGPSEPSPNIGAFKPATQPQVTPQAAPTSQPEPIKAAGKGLLDQMKQDIAAAKQAGERTPLSFPENWAELIQAWKKHKPLQARKLEEAHPLVVSRERIKFAVCESGFASHTLLKADEQAKLHKQLEELFGFQGRLEIIEKQSLGATVQVKPEAEPEVPEPAKPERQASDSPLPEETIPSSPPQETLVPTQAKQESPTQGPSQDMTDPAPVVIPESLLEQRERQAAERREQLIAEVKNAPVTKELLEVFGGSIEDIRTREEL